MDQAATTMPTRMPLTNLQTTQRVNTVAQPYGSAPPQSGKVGDELAEQGGERGRFLLVGGVAGAGDQLHGAAPQGRDGQLPQVVEADQLLAPALQDGQRPREGAGDRDLVGEPARADAGEQAGPGRAVGPQDVGDELVQRQGRTGCGEAPGVGPGLGGLDGGGDAPG